MPRYIDADKLINKIFPIGMVHDGQYTIGAKAIKIAIDKMPTADVVEVVRCKDCGAYLKYIQCEYMGLDGFCSLGFREPQKEGK